MTTTARILGTHAKFFRAGDHFDLPAPGVASQSALPGDNDAGWIDLGAIVDAGVELEGDIREVWAPPINRGQHQLHDVIQTKRGFLRTFTAQEMSPFALEVLYGTNALDALSEDYTALAGRTKKGWILIERYDQEDTLFIRERAFCRLAVVGAVKLGADLVSIPFESRQLIPRTRGAITPSGKALATEVDEGGKLITTEDGLIITAEGIE